MFYITLPMIWVNDIAGFILETYQGWGAVFYPPEFVQAVEKVSRSGGALLVFDEIATGFGRTGKMFAMEHAAVVPDILTVGKSLTGGYMSLAATLASGEVAEAISSGEPGLFMHGPTFMANPLATAVASASLGLLQSVDWQASVRRIEAGLWRGLEPCRQLAGVVDVRVLGAIGVVELEKAVDMASIQQEFVRRGVWVRPFGRLVYLMPPFIIDERDLELLTAAVAEVVALEVLKG